MNKHGAADNPQMPIELRLLTLLSGRTPFLDWLHDLKSRQTSSQIARRVLRVGDGNFGDFKPVGGEVFELRLNFGPGYRVYFAKPGETLVVLLVGGDKSTQQADINRAIQLWKENKIHADRYTR